MESAAHLQQLEHLTLTTHNLWMMVCIAMVFVMHLGFATLEAGLTQAKNTVNILFKNVVTVAIGLLSYAMVGFGLMYPGEGYAGAAFGFSGFGLFDPGAGYSPHYTYWTDFLFQGMFAATAATIVSGAVAERIRLDAFIIFSTLFVAICYPIAGMWHWGGGFLAQWGFHDFAGSTIVHAVGGWGALIGAWMVGPRLGKYTETGIRPIMGHNMPLATMGMFLLWFGWFGFNGGSVLSAEPAAVSLVLVNTSLAAAAGIITATFTTWRIEKKPDLSMVLNGALAGLVAVTAGADVFTPSAAIIVGAIGGAVVVFAVIAIDRAGIDDPVGAISVHLVNGIWGTLAVGIWGGKSLAIQAFGVACIAALACTFAFIVFSLLKQSLGLRVPEHEEMQGLDVGEHGMEAYARFQIFRNL